jgi:hypothetical protein
MAWPPTKADEQAAFKEDGAWFVNQYLCTCGHEWEDEWSCAVDDDRDECGATCSPFESEEIEGPDA